LDLIFRCSCLKAFTPSLPLTPMPCRSDDGCDKIQENPWRCNTLKRGAGPGQDMANAKAGVLMPGEWQEPQRSMGLYHQEQAAAQGEQIR